MKNDGIFLYLNCSDSYMNYTCDKNSIELYTRMLPISVFWLCYCYSYTRCSHQEKLSERYKGPLCISFTISYKSIIISKAKLENKNMMQIEKVTF